METNIIIEELKTIAGMMASTEQKYYYQQKVADARVVECVRMREVFSREEMRFLREFYNPKQKQCYRNASTLVKLMSHPLAKNMFKKPVKYVEGYTNAAGLLPIEHAFVKYGEKHIDPTFEWALKLDVRKEMYVSLIELEPEIMMQYELETNCFGELYRYDYACRNDPNLAERLRHINGNKRR